MKLVRILTVAILTALAAAAPHASPPQPPATPAPTTVHRFAAAFRAGFAPMVEAPDGTLFGVMEGGGIGDYGAIFQLTPGGSGGFAFSILYQFHGTDGAAPRGLTYHAPTDSLFGVTASGGMNGPLYDGAGTIFTLTRTGTLTVLMDLNLDFSLPQPLVPQAPLLLASDANFYGVAGGASTPGATGAIFKVTPAGTVELLHSFNGANGANPKAQLVEGADGFLYGTTVSGGANDQGTVFKIEKDGNNFETLHDFSGGSPDAIEPRGLVRDTTTGSDLFYGLTGAGGSDGRGSIFTITPTGTYQLRASFPVSFDYALKGANPNGALVKGSDGLFYGTTGAQGPTPFAGHGTVFSFDPASNAIEVVHDFNSDPGTGLEPLAGLLVGADGTLFGTTVNGGAHRSGTVYRVDLSASPATVSKVVDVPSLGPAFPQDRMIRASNGFLYGTTPIGGAFNTGAIFRVDAAGMATTIHSFDFIDGAQPSGELVEGSDGNLWGTTQWGGNIQFPGDVGGGTVFRIAKDGTGFTVVHRFQDYAVEGAYPLAGLVEGPDGNFYGTTHQNGPGGAGTVFKVTPAGTLTTLHAFDVWSLTRSTLTLGADGYFYGATREGGATPTGGTLYKVDSSGNFVLLHEFADPPDGAHPNGVMLGTDGNFYGTTEQGGSSAGTLFQLTPAGGFTVLHRFEYGVDGANPTATPFEAGDGKLYGQTWLGGAIAPFLNGLGTVYRYDSSGVQSLHVFDARDLGDAVPYAGLTQGSDNRLWGSTMHLPAGTIYRLDAGITNKPPAVRHRRVSIAPGQLENITLDASDPDGNPLTVTIVGLPAHGTVIGAGPTFQYQPNAGFTGTDFFYVRANDGTVSSPVAGVMVNVGVGNTAPVAYDQSVTISEDVPASIFLNTFDAESNPLTYTVVTPPAHGTLTGAAPDFFYNPAADYNGPDSFTFKVNDGTADSNVATVSITVDPVNDAPVAIDQTITSKSVPVSMTVSATDPDGDALTYQIVDEPLNGVLTGVAPNVTYTPNAGFTGTDSFTFSAHDGGLVGVGTVTISVTPPDRPPVANPGGPYTGDLGEAVSADGSLSSDPDGDPIVSYRWFVDGSPAGTSAVTFINVNAFSPGVHTLMLQVTDGTGLTGSATTTLTVRNLIVSFTAAPNPAACQQAIGFDGTGSDNRPGRTIASYLWTFGDGTNGSGATVSHAFGRFGSYTATLTVLDDLGMAATTNTLININQGNQAPVASPGGPYFSHPSGAVTLNGQASTDPNVGCGDGIVSYEWLVNNSIALIGSSATLSAAQVGSLGQGTFPVRLTVTDSFGAQNTASTTLTIQPLLIATSNALTASATSVGALQPLTLTATVVPASGSVVPTGTVTFFVNGTTAIGTATLVNGVATLNTNAGTVPGSNQLTARYDGTAVFAASTSSPVTITTVQLAASSFTVLLPWTNPQALGSPLTVSAFVLSLDTAPTPTGTVDFYDNGALVGSAPLSGGLATISFTPASAGTHTLLAQYLGSATMAPSTAPPALVTIFSGSAPASTSAALSASPNPVSIGQPVTFTATVTPNTVAGGTVTFFVDGQTVGTAPVVAVGAARRATLTLTSLPLGAHVVSASYGGTSGAAASNSNFALLVVR
jgi:uncharacterized repeat protein (TIGR03803 family)